MVEDFLLRVQESSGRVTDGVEMRQRLVGWPGATFETCCPAAVDLHREELGDLVTGKGTISFEYGRRLPVTLVKKIVKTRLAEVAGKP